MSSQQKLLTGRDLATMKPEEIDAYFQERRKQDRRRLYTSFAIFMFGMTAFAFSYGWLWLQIFSR